MLCQTRIVSDAAKRSSARLALVRAKFALAREAFVVDNYVVRWALLSVALVGCYSPTPHAGARCADGLCPAGLVCSPATDTCEVVAVELDGSMMLADADIDAPVDSASMTTSPDARTCWGTGLLSICPTTMPTQAVNVTASTTINTNNSTLCVPYSGANASAYCVVAATSVSIAAGKTVRAVGAKPLVILSTSSITVDGTINISDAGAGANPGVCVAGGTPTSAQGGAGGSFTGAGGAGGGVATGLGPAGAPATSTPAVRGGCRGGNGGGTTAGNGGDGGGAIYLIAASSISVSATGSINASGGAGLAAAATNSGPGAGGGGGGAGGFIGFDAPTVSVIGAAYANGGGGGEGATPNHAGSDGSISPSALTAGAGGSGGAKKGGNGGAGAQGATRAGANATAGGNCGRGGASGGGGGGAAGMIYVHPTQALVGEISPPTS